MARKSKPDKQESQEGYMDRKLYRKPKKPKVSSQYLLMLSLKLTISKHKQHKSQSDSTLDHLGGGSHTYFEHSNVGPSFGYGYQGYHGPARNPQIYIPAVQAQGINSNPQWFGNPNNMAYPSRPAPTFNPPANQAYWSSVPNAYPVYASPGYAPPANSHWVQSARAQRATSQGGNSQPQYMPPRHDSRQSHPVNEPSRLRGDAPEFIPTHGPPEATQAGYPDRTSVANHKQSYSR
ncbi:hypothetical protein FQN49_007250 [Arthroderma sp. PD_2]|nr:hypothetical protein FQN49_007250 [Arthroderma sp. PD_2]